MPFSRVDWIASPMQLSSSVAEKPPCTVPAGLRWSPLGSRGDDHAPARCFGDVIAQGPRDRVEGQRAIGEPLDEFQAAHFLAPDRR